MTGSAAQRDPWEGLIELLPVGVTISHYPSDNPAEGYLVAANPAASRMLGFDLSPFIGVVPATAGIDDRFDESAAVSAAQMSYEVAIGGAPMALEDFVIEVGPGRGHYQSTIFPMPGRRAASVFRSTDREAAANQALDWAMNSLETANRALASFASTVAHDLKNPLTGIAGNAELVKMTTPDLSADAASAIDRVMELSTASASMVDGLLRFAKAPAVMASEEVDIGAVVEWSATMLADQIEAQSAQLEVSGAGSVVANEAAIRQVLLNLLSNSLRYRHPNRLLVISVDVVAAEDRIHIAVTDNGGGIEPAMHERVFEWGTRNDTEASAPGGTGLGLAASRAALTSLGGTIEIAESSATGTTICITLPSAG